MRTPGRRRPRKETRYQPSRQAELSEIAEKASYTPSPEHKDYLTSAGPGRLRSDASACPRGLDFNIVLEWLRGAISDGNISADFEGDFPRYAWARVDDRAYEARLSNSGLGEYKGYPILDQEAPGWLQ